MASAIGLPEGFVLNEPATPQAAPQQLPQGFVVDPAPTKGSLTPEQFSARFGDIPDIKGLIAPQQPKPSPTIGEQIVGAGEAALTVGTGITGGTLGALGGTLKGVVDEIRAGKFGTDAAVHRIADKASDLMQELTFAPRTEAGQQITKAIGEAGEALAPLSGLGGQVAQLGQATKAAAPGIRAQATLAGKAPAVEAGKELATAVFTRQSPTKQRIAKLLEEGSADVETAKFELKEPKVTISPSDTLALDAPGATPKPKSKLREFLDVGGPKVKTDREAVETIRQGFDEGVIAAVKGSGKADKAKMLKMVDIMEKGKKNKLFAAKNRPSDVAGDSLLDRFRTVKSANKKAGSELDGVANSLKGRKVDSSPAIDTFIDDLGGLGVTLDDNLRPIFRGSDIEGVTGAERVINQIVGRMRDTKAPDGHDIHRLKRFIDEQVTFGKTTEGLSGRTESILKSLRRNLDGTLDRKFPEYDRVNTVYSETIGVIDDLQDVAGRKLNLTGPNADKAVGTLLRRLMSNAQSRVRLLDSIDGIEKVAVKHGSKLDDDLLSQVLFVDELDAKFGPVARTSLAGELGKEIKRGGEAAKGSAVDIAVDVAAKGAEKALGINDQNAFKSIKALLKKGTK
jgi:hypothetical protein